MIEIPKLLPVTPLRDGPMFPNTESVLIFSRNKAITALEAAFRGDRLIFIVAQKNGEGEVNKENLFEIGTVCQIKHVVQSENELSILVSGICRAKLTNLQSVDPYLLGEIEQIPEIVPAGDDETQALARHLVSEFQSAVRLGSNFDFIVLMKISSGLNPSALADQIAATFDIPAFEKQRILEETDVKNRLKLVAEFLSKEMKVLELERKINSQTQAKFDKTARQAILRERKKAIEDELEGLGSEDSELSEVKQLYKKVDKVGMPEDVLKKAKKEIKKLEQMSPMNPEAGYVRNYVEWLLDMPWNVSTKNISDIGIAAKVLDEDHFGLEKVKERILEYLAVLKLKVKDKEIEDGVEHNNGKTQLPNSGGDFFDKKASKKKTSSPTILCFVGPPGVGKTSIGKSIAKALGRKFVRVSLGGIRDEAEIRGHRRTYVGALPGRIIQGIKQAGSNNPVFMLDEMDKIGSDFRGDPSAALLEALDPEQNSAFSDHYLEVPFDLSNVIFIATANLLDTIPPALLDRLEVIHFPGYTSDEKLMIGKKYLIPKQIEVQGLTRYNVTINDETLKQIITRYTHEAGVRNLEREIAKIFRKIAKKMADGKTKTQKMEVTLKDLQKYLGAYKFSSTLKERKDEVGMSTGLFVTQAGGGILHIEVAIMPGKGQLILTGQLGDVMQESAKAAVSYVRSRWKELGLDEKIFSKIDIHIHVPAGAQPKDGPSAGIALTTALASALTKIPVRRDLAMTGEVTLRGRVLEIGGVKEKVIGAHMAGIKTIVMPKDNKKDLEDIPKYVLSDLKFQFVSNMDEVLDLALKNVKQ